MHRIHTRQSDDVKAAGHRLAISAERRPAGNHRRRKPIHIRPVLLEQVVIVSKRFHSRRVAAVHEEVQLVPNPKRST
jgi:hypothetical protein